jgi:NAD(P)-dependent dehydrogenase (short-subunit alcohol dehydrogenase family)
VAILDLHRESAEAVAREIVDQGGEAFAIGGDITGDDAPRAAVAAAVDRFGRIDFLHNNAFARWRGQDSFAPVGEVSDAHWDHVMDVGLRAMFRMTRAVLPVMVDQKGGAIVNMSSTAGYHPERGVAAYSVSKAAVLQLTRSTAIEYADRGIRCNAVCPGVIRTPLIEGAPDDVMTGIPMGRFGEAAELANVILFLASDLASYVTGAMLVADGGRTV